MHTKATVGCLACGVRKCVLLSLNRPCPYELEMGDLTPVRCWHYTGGRDMESGGTRAAQMPLWCSSIIPEILACNGARISRDWLCGAAEA